MPEQSKYIYSDSLASTLKVNTALDRVAQKLAKANAKIDRAVRKADRVLAPATAKREKSIIRPLETLVRRLASVALVCGLVLSVAARAEAQTQRTDLCVPGVIDIYRFTVPAFTQHEFRVYAEKNNPGIFFLIFNPDNDVRGSASSNSRSLYWSAGLIRGRHQVGVACLRQTRYHIVHVRGNEIRLAAPTYVSYLTGAYFGSKVGAKIVFDVDLEEPFQRARSELMATERDRP